MTSYCLELSRPRPYTLRRPCLSSSLHVKKAEESKRARQDSGAENSKEKEKFIYIGSRIEKSKNQRKIGAPVEKLAKKNVKNAGFRQYKRRTATALDSSSLELKTCSQEAAAPAENLEYQSGDPKGRHQGLAPDLPGPEYWTTQGRLDLLHYVERTLNKDYNRQDLNRSNFEDIRYLEPVSSLTYQQHLT